MAGDVICAVNGIGEQHLDGLTAVRELLKNEAGTRFTVAIERDGVRKEVKLELADLLYLLELLAALRDPRLRWLRTGRFMERRARNRRSPWRLPWTVSNHRTGGGCR